MINVTVEELRKIRQTIDDALAMHERWLDNIHRTFACGLSPAEADLAENAHHRCDFGRWFYSKSNTNLRRLPALVQVGELHEAMHKTVREICAKLKALGQVTADDYDVLTGEIKRFREALITLQNKVDYTLQNVDPLTGAITSKQLLPDLKSEQQRLRETGEPYSLLLVDIDVKEINYSYGHETGDEVLRSGIATIKEVLAGSGRVYRYSGAEFIVSLPGKTQEEAEELKVQLLQQIAQSASNTLAEPRGALNIHHGIAMLDPKAYIEELIDRCARSTYTFDFDAKPVESAPTESEPSSDSETDQGVLPH